MLLFQFELNYFFYSEDLIIECVAVSYVLPPGDNDNYDGMSELEDYVDVVADLLMVNKAKAEHGALSKCTRARCELKAFPNYMDLV